MRNGEGDGLDLAPAESRETEAVRPAAGRRTDLAAAKDNIFVFFLGWLRGFRIWMLRILREFWGPRLSKSFDSSVCNRTRPMRISGCGKLVCNHYSNTYLAGCLNGIILFFNFFRLYFFK